MTIRAVLDHSALLSYARGHVHVGEVIGEIADDGDGQVGIPVTALIEAHYRISEGPEPRLLLRHLTALPHIRLLQVDEKSAVGIGAVARLTGGDLARAHAAWAMLARGVPGLTAEPDRMPSIVDPAAIVAIPPEDS